MNSAETTAFAHSAFLYESREELLERTIPYLREGAAVGQALLVAMPRANLRLLREKLGDGLSAQFMDLEEVGRNPARLIAAWRELADEHGAAGIRGVSEAIWSGRSAAEIEECERHDLLLNYAFAALPECSLLCTYDLTRLEAAVLDRVGRTHPELIEDSGPPRESGTYVAPEESEPFAGSLPKPRSPVVAIEFDGDGLGEGRAFLRVQAERAGLGSERAADLVLAGNEVATNSVEHGGGRGTMRVWQEADSLVCEVADRGRIDSALVGRLRPATEQPRGRGLWLANQVCDLVQIRSGDAGTVVRLSLEINA